MKLQCIFACALAVATFQIQAQATPIRPVLKFSKIVMDADSSKAAQKVRVGTICLFAGAPISFGTERTLTKERFERLFINVANEHGWTVESTATDMFDGEGSTTTATFLIGAKLRVIRVDVCDSLDGQKGTIEVVVEWQVFDREKKQVVATVNTPGRGMVGKFNQDGYNTLFNDAFVSAAKALASTSEAAAIFGPAVPATAAKSP